MTKQSIISKLPLLLLLLAIASPAMLAAQAVPDSLAAFKGLVLDATEARVPGAAVSIEGNDRRWRLQSDDNGEFKVELPRGSYNFLIERDGFKKLFVPNFTVKSGAEKTFKFSLDVGACSDCDNALYDGAPGSPTALLSAFTVDPTGNGNSRVAVLIAGGNRTWQLQSGALGEFNINLPAGTYTVTLEKRGFKKTVINSVVVKPEARSSDLMLVMEPGDPTDEVRYAQADIIEDPISYSALAHPVPAPQSAPNIVVTGNLTPSVKSGRAAKGTITIDIPAGYHINSNHPLEEFLVATKLTVEAPQGIRVGPIVYPPPLLRTFKFSKNKLSVYEGKVVLRFSLTVPATVAPGTVEMKAKLRYQSCNDSLCFPPKNIDVNLSLTIN